MGFYAASKHALEGLAESLDHETRSLGIRAVLVEPSWTRTGIDTNGADAARPIDDYAGGRTHARDGVRANVDAGDDPLVVAKAVVEAATADTPRLRYPVGKGASLLAGLKRFLPASMLDSALHKQFGLNSKGDPRAPLA